MTSVANPNMERPMSDTMPPLPNGVIAYLSVAGGEAALGFYEAAFDGRVIYRQMAPDGKRILHARVALNGGLIMLSDDFPEYNGGVSQAPPPGQPTGMVLHMTVADCDALFHQAVAAGGTPAMPPPDMFWGDRYARVRDPFGHTWSIGTPIRK
jgi:PhnB protein